MAQAWVYVLELDNDCRYVGFTKNLEARMWQHFNDPQVGWVKAHAAKRIIMAVKAEDLQTERYWTLKLMSDLEWQKIRGYTWVKVDMPRCPSAVNCFWDTRDDWQYASEGWLREIERRVENGKGIEW